MRAILHLVLSAMRQCSHWQEKRTLLNLVAEPFGPPQIGTDAKISFSTMTLRTFSSMMNPGPRHCHIDTRAFTHRSLLATVRFGRSDPFHGRVRGRSCSISFRLLVLPLLVVPLLAILDPFCGTSVGGNAIAFARTCKRGNHGIFHAI